MNLTRPPVTKEHGSWAILFVPLILGIITAPVRDMKIVPLVITVGFLFMAYIPLELLLRGKRTGSNYFWAVLFGTAGIVPGLWLVLFGGRPWLPLFAAGAVLFYLIKIFFEKRLGKNLWSDTAGILMLTLSAPAAVYVLSGAFDEAAIALYAVSALHFTLGGIYVHLLITGIKDPVKKRKGSALFLPASMLMLALIVAVYGPGMVIIFLPLYIYIYHGLKKRSPGRPDFKRVGMQLLFHSIWMLITASLLWVYVL